MTTNKNGKQRRTRAPSTKMAAYAEPLDTDRDLWEMQSTESPRAFLAFKCYRDMEPLERSPIGVSDIIGSSHSTTKGWSSKFSWVARAREWDMEAERRLTKQHWADLKKMSTRHVNDAMAQQRALLEPVMAFTRELEKTPDLLMSVFKRGDGSYDVRGLSTIMGMIVEATKLYRGVVDMEREARGQPTLLPGDSGVGGSRRDVKKLVEDDETRALAVEFFAKINGIS